ncbi:MAG: (E)-4-hydroxy-3-methylbut-2-enyl-diphosphate synthase [Pseudarcicella sp.]|nr:(E)-4-hydroxy-3-methylbut-2-enyl-diphosphate synthase [Pseudarcicella sp.]MBP6410047.1 (E)-4-hydroxy-3-methylbut-2-enyl-diphosphate synthase [Pseudarcicella sp.]
MSTNQSFANISENGNQYCDSLLNYSRRKTITANIGGILMGSEHPIRVQSMTTIDTLDTIGSVEQCIRMIESGCEYIRITAPSVKEAQNLENIQKELRKRGHQIPLIADIHFTPNAAELAARIVAKVRINPGNYSDKKRFETIEYTEQTYQNELQRIRDKFLPLVKICKENGTAMRIGTNHGSLSDRILSRYGDTPLGMVESALEFLRICEDENYANIVLSMKSSNTQVMVQAYRLLCKKLNEEGLKPYPLHLGVTEAGDGEDGRIKSAVGIGTLLEDGIGDTVRVSLTEDPELEAPVAKSLIDRYTQRTNVSEKNTFNSPINPFQYTRRKTNEVLNIGASNVPRVIADFSVNTLQNVEDLKHIGHFYLPATDKWAMNDQGADYIYTGSTPAPFMLPMGLKEIVNFDVWQNSENKTHIFPLIKKWEGVEFQKNQTYFLLINNTELSSDLLNILSENSNIVLIVESHEDHGMAAIRKVFFELSEKNIKTPIIIKRNYPAQLSTSDFQLFAATDCGALLIDGFGDGIILSNETENQHIDLKSCNQTAFGILQAARTRMSKTEYISCPSCGRTLFDLQETTAKIRKKTDHLKGIKIGIMGCIVNGPGEMADADYGYVGVGKDKIALYRGQEVIKKSVHPSVAVDELIEIIKEDGVWFEPNV